MGEDFSWTGPHRQLARQRQNRRELALLLKPSNMIHCNALVLVAPFDRFMMEHAPSNLSPASHAGEKRSGSPSPASRALQRTLKKYLAKTQYGYQVRRLGNHNATN